MLHFLLRASQLSFRYRTCHPRPEQNQQSQCETILRPVFRGQYHMVDEYGQGEKESHFLGCESVFVRTCLLLYARDLNIVSDGDDGSVLLVKVYQKHHGPLRRDELVGSLTYTIGEITRKLNNGGTRDLCMTCCTDAISAIKVLEEPLRKDTSDESGLAGITIKFGFAAILREGPNASELQAADAVTKMTETVSALGSTPPVVSLLGSAVDTGTNVVTKVQTFETTWGALLKRMELFNKIVADIAAVFHVHRLDFLSV